MDSNEQPIYRRDSDSRNSDFQDYQYTNINYNITPQNEFEQGTEQVSNYNEVLQVSNQEKKQEPMTYQSTHSNLSSDKHPLTAARIGSSMLKEAMINSYILYRVHIVWNNKEFEVIRRFSDFQALRAAICNLLPFTYVFPVHKKQLIVIL
jgi:hypothetical protein